MKHSCFFRLIARGWSCEKNGFRHEVYQCECGRRAELTLNPLFFEDPEAAVDYIMAGPPKLEHPVQNGRAS